MRKGRQAKLVGATQPPSADYESENQRNENKERLQKIYVPLDRHASEAIPINANEELPFRHMYRLDPQEIDEVTNQVAELLKKGSIKPSTAPHGSPILFATKKEGTLRMVIDY